MDKIKIANKVLDIAKFIYKKEKCMTKFFGAEIELFEDKDYNMVEQLFYDILGFSDVDREGDIVADYFYCLVREETGYTIDGIIKEFQK